MFVDIHMPIICRRETEVGMARSSETVVVGYCWLIASLVRSVKVKLPGAAARRCRKPGGEGVRADTAGKGSFPAS